MSQENVELARTFTNAFNAHDLETMVACCDPKAEFRSTFTAVGGGVYHGHEGVRSWQRDLEEALGNELYSEPEAFFDLDERTLVYTVLHGQGKQSGAQVTLPMAAIARFRDGLCINYCAYIHREDALADLGVTEDGLERIAP